MTLTPDDLTLAFLNGAIGFLATSFGVVLALLLTMRYDRNRKRVEDREIQRRAIMAIKQEIETTSDFLTGLNFGEGPREFVESYMFLWTDAYQSAIASGVISSLRPIVQTALGNVYLNFRIMERYGQKLLSLAGMSGDERLEQWKLFFVNAAKGQTKSILDLIPKMMKVIDYELEQLN